MQSLRNVIAITRQMAELEGASLHTGMTKENGSQRFVLQAS